MKRGTDYKNANDLIDEYLIVEKNYFCTGHAFKKGDILKVSRVNTGNPDYFYFYGVETNSYCTPSYLNLLPMSIDNLNMLIDKNEKELIKIKDKIDDLKLKIKFIKDNNLKEFDENEFKVYCVLQELKTNSSDIEKSKIIAKLINN